MKNLQSLANLKSLGGRSGNSAIQYLLKDTFSTNLAAGSVNNTQADIGGARTVVDTNSKISITGGVLNFATGEAANDLIKYTSRTRVAGEMFFVDVVSPNNSSANLSIGGGLTDAFRLNGGTNGLTILAAGVANLVGAIVVSTSYQLLVVERIPGAFFFIKGGTFTNWTLVWVGASGSAAFLPQITSVSTTVVATIDNIRIPSNRWLPTPLAYDTFTRSNGALGNTGTTGPDNQGVSALAWTQTLGTWAISSNAALCSALSGGSAFATVDAGKADILIDIAVTRAAGVAGMIFRYSDSSNYIIAYHDGTNVKLDKVIAGITTNIISAVATYSAGAILRVIASGSSFQLFYNNAKIGSTSTISDSAVQSPTVHGLYTTDTGNTLDNLLIMARGTSNEYVALIQY